MVKQSSEASKYTCSPIVFYIIVTISVETFITSNNSTNPILDVLGVIPCTLFILTLVLSFFPRCQ